MARKRLTPLAAPAAPESKAMGLARTVTREAPPIARVTGESAAQAALATLADEMTAARAEGRLILSLPLDQVAEDHLVRDRLALDEEEMQVLMRSLADRGQQTPIDVVDRGEDAVPRYGLISGYRRLAALRRLRAETGEVRFDAIRALVRRPENAADAYRAMVDENEIRLGLSYWERARIVARAAELGLYPTAQLALRGLFGTASRAKRSKIGSFVALYEGVGEALRFPTALPERLGLRLARAVQDGAAESLRAALAEAAADSAEAEQAALTAALARIAPESGAESGTDAAEAPPAPTSPRGGTPAPAAKRARGEAAPDPATPDPAAPARAVKIDGAAGPVRLQRLGTNQLLLEGAGLDQTFEAELAAWLSARTPG
jgi:ParB-like chromosome segregation protein Spo0J